MALQLKRIYEAPAASDGQRIFVDRLWARGISKERAALTDWDKEIAPSAELRKQFGHDPEKFPAFKREYERELATNEMTKAFIEKIRSGLAAGNVTLLFGAKDEQHNNAVVLKEFIEAHLTK
ncbi:MULTISPECIES: DUF488 domain-containing protein [Furfurilactobacillus]|uniref:DUF488 family protein n=1 Tax=Furfurilactobacillus rossiae TaxID=231049 RepID=A0A7C9ISC1_9LACO|nr:DUF488 family protein [Furfurilactobacillus milii]MYV04974.1 DUF488 family protein [Furfurilactobacillus milii]